MLTQAVPMQPYKSFGQATAMPGAHMMPPPRIPPPNVYPPGFNQFKQINIPPPGMLQPMAMGADLPPQIMPGVHQSFTGNQQGLDFDARRQQRRNLQRRTVDYNASVVQQIKNRVWRKTSSSLPFIQPDVLCYVDLPSPRSLVENPVNSVATRFVRTATNKIRCPLFSLSWTPEGRRLITGASSGEFTLWGGLAFNFETVLQAHESAVRAMQWSHNDTWLISADHSGLVKYWQSNMNNVKTLQAHNDPVRGVGFSPTDNKFATGSDDGTVKIWDFYRCHEERVLRGHGADVKCIDWHPSKGLIVSGSKDSQQPLKLWDPKSGASLSTIHIHKSTVMDLQWNRNGNWLLTASRDHLIKVFDIRAMKEIQTFRGHKKEATAVDWHPIHESLFASGGSDGAIMFWNMGLMKELGAMDHAHDAMIWSVRWHPLGHILASGSNDHTCKFWTRNRPGDKMRDKYNLNTNPLGDDDYEYDVPVVNETSTHNVSDVSAASAEASLPGLSLSKHSPSTPAPPGPTGIPGIDMDFTPADSLKKEHGSKLSQLQTARTSAFKLPNILTSSSNNMTDKLRVSASSFAPKVVSTFKMPKAEEVRAILQGKPIGSQGEPGQPGFGGRGLLPTPSKDSQVHPSTNMKGIFDPFEIEPGFVIEAEDVWLDEKMAAREEEKSHVDMQSRKRARRPNFQFHGNDEFINQENSPFPEDGGPRRPPHHTRTGLQEGDLPSDEDRQYPPSGWREPPEKRRLLQEPPGFHPLDGNSASGPPGAHRNEDHMDYRAPFPPNRGRPKHAASTNFENWSAREGPIGNENHPFPEQRDHQENAPGPGPNRNGSPRGEAHWNEQIDHELHNHPGFSTVRGRGRGKMNHSMQRQGPQFARGDANSSIRPPFHDPPFGKRTPIEPNIRLPWRGRGSGHFDGNAHDNIPPQNNSPSNEWDGANYLPGQRRGPHPLLRRGRGAGMIGARRPSSLEGRAPAPLAVSPKSAQGNIPSPNEKPVTIPSESTNSWREGPKLKGLMDETINHASEQEHWQVDNVVKGT